MAFQRRGPTPLERETLKVYGLRPTLEALDAGQELEKVFVRQGLNSDVARDVLQRLRKAGVPVQYVPETRLNQFTSLDKHQGMLAFVSPIRYQMLEEVVMRVYESGREGLYLLPAGVTDVRNLGSLARTAECMGVDALLLPANNSARVNADAIKTSAGALFHLPVCRLPYPAPAADYLLQSGIRMVACHERGEFRLSEVNFTLPTCLVVGSEDEGIPAALLEKCAVSARAPMLGKVASLNVAVATGMALYEAQRQRLAS